MKISDRNTALGLLDHIDPFAFRICEDAEHSTQEYKTRVGLSIVSEWPKVVSHFKEKIQYISDPFYEAYNLACPKLSNVIDDQPINESGTFISRSTPSETNTIFYHIATEGKEKEFQINAVIFFFTKEASKDKPALAIVVQRNAKGYKSFLSETAVKHGLDEMKVISDVFTLILFMKYCELQSKIIEPKSKANLISTKYVNESNHKVEILDSTWFTTIVRSEGFHVRGHFRMQPFKEGKKLIWISDFDKTGYTRKAKILSQ